MADPFDNPIPVATSFSVPSVLYDRNNIGSTGAIISSDNAAIPPSVWLVNGQDKFTYPSVEYYNWLHAYLHNQVNYVRQVGIADWDAMQVYNIGDVVRVVNGRDTKFRRSLLNNNQGKHPTDINYWSDFLPANKVVNGNFGKQLNVNSRGIVHQTGSSSVRVLPNRTISNGRDFLLVDGWHAYAGFAATSGVLFNIEGDNINGRRVTIPASNVTPFERPGFIGKAYDENFSRRVFGAGLFKISCRCRIQVDNNTNIESIDYWSIFVNNDYVPRVDNRNMIAGFDPVSTSFTRVSNGTSQFVYFDFDHVVGNYFEFLIKATAGNPLTISGWDLTLTSDNFTNEPIIGSGYDEELTNCLRYYEVIPPYHYINWAGASTFTTYWLPFTVLKRVVPSLASGFESYNRDVSPKRNGVNVNIDNGGLFTVGNPDQGINAYVYADR